jgi:hypothetical protein
MQGLQSCLVSASQVLASGLERRHGFNSLAHRAGVAIASSVTMRHTASRALVAEWHIVTCHVFKDPVDLVSGKGGVPPLPKSTLLSPVASQRW